MWGSNPGRSSPFGAPGAAPEARSSIHAHNRNWGRPRGTPPGGPVDYYTRKSLQTGAPLRPGLLRGPRPRAAAGPPQDVHHGRRPEGQPGQADAEPREAPRRCPDCLVPREPLQLRDQVVEAARGELVRREAFLLGVGPPLPAPLSWTTCGSSAPTGSCGVYCCADDGEPFTIAWASLSWDAKKINTAFPLT